MTRHVVAVAFAAAVAFTGTAWAAGTNAEPNPYAAMQMYVGNPHEATASEEDKKFEAMIAEKRRKEVAAWSGAYSRDVYPEYGLGSVHTDQGR